MFEVTGAQDVESAGRRHPHAVAAARADFLEHGQRAAAGVPELLTASWERSRSAGVDVDRPESDYVADIDTSSRLVRCARPVLDQLGADISDIALVIALTDNKARMIERLDISVGMGRLVDRVEFAPGFSYAEETMGTNGVGTVIGSGKAVSVVGAEHYAESLQQFACTAAPVIDPITGRLEGVLDVSTVARAWSPLMHTLVRAAATDIGRNLLLDRSQAQQVLFNTYLRADARSSKRAVFGFAESVTMANAAAQTLFDHDEQAAIRDHAAFLMTRRDRVSDTFALSSGRHVRVRGTRIVSGQIAAGIVVIAEPIQTPAATIAADGAVSSFSDKVLPDVAVASAKTQTLVTTIRREHRAAAAGGASPACVRACGELRESMAACLPTIVFGEPGSGRFTLVLELFHADHPRARSLSIAAHELDEGVGIDLAALREQTPSGMTLVIVRDIDQLGPAGSANLCRLMDAAELASTHVMVVATAAAIESDDKDSVVASELMSCFKSSIALPPLRHRTEDIEYILDRIIGDLAPHRHVRFSPAALRTIAAFGWPGNIAQLRDAVTEALKARPVGEIGVDDLPRYCLTQSKSYNLSPIQVAERDAIIAALQEYQGNRVAAAASVGISRSSLYRKIKSYGITS
ncbi:sigma-54-dependent Fis family transcriptional regulator [Gordonia sp. NPDC062954]|uniref:sigma-54-dependent Fis family transcriptional regulator n=1 Tax=Gordonia sp. NPDC062954 TaxID=3364003 RepID=UPI0037C5D853